jgi:pimeloyl-ACP methyl ester carboxylesterase
MRPSCRMTFVLAAALAVVCTASAYTQRVVPGYEPPVPGALLSVVFQERVSPQQIALEGVLLFEHFPTLEPRYATDIYRLTFWTSDADGSPVHANASLYIPVSRSAILAPVLAFGSGTTGLGNQCAPSLERPEIQRLGWYRANMLAYSGQGIITIFPDYVGFGDPRMPQRYFSKYAEGYLMLDSLRAARAVASSMRTLMRTNALPSAASFTAGYSQGGHAALAAADLLTDYAPEIDLVGAIGFGSTNSVEALMREAGYYPPNIIYAYIDIYGRELIRPEELLQPRWLLTLEYDVLTKCVREFQLYYPYDIRQLYTERFYKAITERRLSEDFPVIKRILDENESGLSGHGVPVLMIQGAADIIVSNEAQREYVERLRATGVQVTYVELPRVLHRQTRPAGFYHSVEFIRGLLVP